jgi:hypothetical protein
MSIEWSPMQGPRVAKEFVTDYLRADLPSRLQLYRNAWNLDDDLLPEPVKYLDYEPVAIDAWPSIHTVVVSTKGFYRSDYEMDGDPIYKVTYATRTYIWCRGESSEICTKTRDNLTTVVRSALLDYPCLTYADKEDREVLLEEGSLTEEWSDLTPLKGERVMAGAYLGYDLSLQETVSRRGIAELESIDIETLPLPIPADPDF